MRMFTDWTVLVVWAWIGLVTTAIAVLAHAYEPVVGWGVATAIFVVPGVIVEAIDIRRERRP